MNFLEALILGIVQGLTEFLPVSSSGHIELGKELLGLSEESLDDLTFTIVVHFATVLSTIIVFRKDIISIFKKLLKFEMNEETQFSLKILISMIPVFLVGMFLKDEVEALFDGNTAFVGSMLLVTGLLLLLTIWVKRESRPINYLMAFIIGLAQAFAVLPGVSRSGSTIAMGLMLGADRSKIARFSFLMVIPPILGITLLDIKDAVEGGGQIDVMILSAGFIGAFITGLIACTAMINIVKKGKIQYFAYYCFIVGIIAIVVGW